MATIAELAVKVIANVEGLSQGLQQASLAIDAFGSKAHNIAARLSNVSVAAGVVGTAIITGLGVSVKAAAEAAREQTLLAAAIQGSTRSAELSQSAFNAQAASLQKITAFSDEQIATVQRLLVTFNLTQQQVEELTPRILNLSTTFGVNLDSAAIAVGKSFTVGVGALRRFGVSIDESLDPTKNFAGLLTAIDQNTGQSAIAIGQTLPGAFNRLRNAISDVLEKIGAPLLQPLTDLVNRVATVVFSIGQWAEKNEGLVRVIVTIAGVLGVALLAFTGLVAVLAVIGTVIPAVTAAFGLMGIGAGAILPILLGITLAITALVAGLAIAVPAIIRNWDQIKAAFAGAVAFIGRLVGDFATGIAKILLGLFTFDPSQIIEGAKQLAGSVSNAVQAFSEARNASLALGEAEKIAAAQAAHLKGEHQDLTGALRDQVPTIQELKNAYEEAAAAADLFQKKSDLAATEQARTQLQQPGLNEAALTAIQERLARRERTNEAENLRAKIAATQQEIALAKKRGVEGTELVKEAEKRLVDFKLQLGKTSLRNDQEVAKARVEAEKSAAQQRLETERAVRDAQLELQKTTVEAERSILQSRADLEEQFRQQRLDALRLEEETRLGMLRRVVGLEKTLGAGIIDARVALANIASTREEAALKIANINRERLVKEGFLTEEEARQQQTEQAIRLSQTKAQRELEIEQERIQQFERRQQIEAGLLASEAASRITVLEAERDARIAQLNANQALREVDLTNAITTARAETQAKIAEIEAQAQVRAIDLQQQIDERRAAGLDTAAVSAQREAALANVQRGAAAQRAALLAGQENRERAFNDAIINSRKATESATQAVSKETAVKKADIESQLQGELLRLQTAGVTERAAIAQRIAQLTADLEVQQAEQVQALRDQGLSEAQIQNLLRPTQSILTGLKQLGSEQVGLVQTGLTTLQTAYQTFATAVLTILQPVIDKIKEMTSPEAIQNMINLLKQFPTLPPSPAVRPALPGAVAPGVGGIAGAGAQTVNVPLVVDGQTLGQVALNFIDGRLTSWAQATPTT